MTTEKRKFDPITLEILWKRLVSIVDESDASVIRTAFSSLLRDAHDYTCMFTDSRGQELVQGTLCTPGMAGAMAQMQVPHTNYAHAFWQNILPGRMSRQGFM